MRLLAAPDKFRGTLSALDVALAIELGAAGHGFDVDLCPLSDGGEGFRSVFPGAVVTAAVHGPLGEPLTAPFTRLEDLAVVEMADAAGRHLLPHPQGDDPLMASTRGVGELIGAAFDDGARTVIVGCGGSATTDGGPGAVEVVRNRFNPTSQRLIAATDVTTKFCDAAAQFAPQKGASLEQIIILEQRLKTLVDQYRTAFGVDVSQIPRSGAAGGLAGGLLALGGEVCSGFSLVANAVDLERRIHEADLVVTGEGGLDATTLEGKTVSTLLAMVGAQTPVLVITGTSDPGVTSLLEADPAHDCTVISLRESMGLPRALAETATGVQEAVGHFLDQRWPRNT